MPLLLLAALLAAWPPSLLAQADTSEDGPGITRPGDHAVAAKRRAFQAPRPEAAEEAARDVLLVFGIGMAAVFVMFLGWARYYAPRASQTPYRPTPVRRASSSGELPTDRETPEPRNKPDPLERDRHDMEVDWVEYTRRLEPEGEKREPF